MEDKPAQNCADARRDARQGRAAGNEHRPVVARRHLQGVAVYGNLHPGVQHAVEKHGPEVWHSTRQ